MGKSRKIRDLSSSKSLSNEKCQKNSLNKSSKEHQSIGKENYNTRNNQKDEVQQYYQSKICQICERQDNQGELLLCDRCDDSFHKYCLNPPLEQVPQDDWMCPVCCDQVLDLQNRRNSMIMNERDTTCFSCHELLNRKEFIKGKDINNNDIEIPCKSLVDLTCLHCKHTFHNICFSQRKNSLNCSSCEKLIRKRGPKSHDEFMKYIENSIESVTHSDYRILEHLSIINSNSHQQRHRYERLKIPNFMTTWQFIVQNQASIYYAFVTKGLTFIDEQIYHNQEKDQLMGLNNPAVDVQGKILRLHPRDEKAYQQFKINSKKGYVGPFQVKQDRIKGFYLTATDYIEPYTIVSEYVGEVMRSREALNYEENDSIFLLVRGARSRASLDIVPQKYGNISRFFAGINNTLKRSLASKLQNIKSLRFSYKGRVHLLLHTIKPIQAGETLYFDYNGSAFQEYPTSHFIH